MSAYSWRCTLGVFLVDKLSIFLLCLLCLKKLHFVRSFVSFQWIYLDTIFADVDLSEQLQDRMKQLASLHRKLCEFVAMLQVNPSVLDLLGTKGRRGKQELRGEALRTFLTDAISQLVSVVMSSGGMTEISIFWSTIICSDCLQTTVLNGCGGK